VFIADLACVPKIRRSQVMTITKNHPDFGKPLELCQISNIMIKARRDDQNSIVAAGGDFNAVLAFLEKKSRSEG
jgi:hypothetical protein